MPLTVLSGNSKPSKSIDVTARTLKKCHGPVITYLLVQLDKGRLVQLVQIGALVVGVLHVAEALAQVSLLWQEDLLDLSGQGVQGNLNVLGVADLLELHMGNLLVVHDSWVVRRHVSWQFGEISGHFLFDSMFFNAAAISEFQAMKSALREKEREIKL